MLHGHVTSLIAGTPLLISLVKDYWLRNVQHSFAKVNLNGDLIDQNSSSRRKVAENGAKHKYINKRLQGSSLGNNNCDSGGLESILHVKL